MGILSRSWPSCDTLLWTHLGSQSPRLHLRNSYTNAPAFAEREALGLGSFTPSNQELLSWVLQLEQRSLPR